jgi:hypothetical protein
MGQKLMERLMSVLLAPSAAVGGYFLWLGWHVPKQVHPDGSLTGPYKAWQVMGFILTLAAIAAAITWWSKTVWIAPILITAATTAYFSVQGATDSDSDGLWPVGAVLTMIGTAFWTGLVAIGVRQSAK